MSIKSFSCTLGLSLFIQFVGVLPCLAQESLNTSAGEAASCIFDIGRGVDVIVTTKYEKENLVGGELRFRRRLVDASGKGKLEIAAQRVQIYSLWTETRVSPMSLHQSVFETAEPGQPRTQVQSINFSVLPLSGRRANIGFVFLENAARLDKVDIGKGLTFGAPQPQINGSELQGGEALKCPIGLKNLTPKDYLTSRLLSKDSAVGLEAAIELLGGEDTAEPGSLMLASYWINKAENPKLALRTFYKSMYRLKCIQERYSAVFMPYVIGVTAPVMNDHAVLNTSQVIEALQDVLTWDERTVLEWVNEMGLDPNDAVLKKNRNAVKKETLKLIADLQSNPKASETQLRKYADPFL